MTQRFAVIGAGPAGIAAAIQLAGAGRDVTLFEPGRIGGNLWNAGFVENYPGFPGGIAGWHLARLMEEHFHEQSLTLRPVPVMKVENAGNRFIVTSDGADEFQGVIICTGTRPRKAGFPGEEELLDFGLLHHGIADLPELDKGSRILVIGGGEASMDISLTLAERGMDVTLLHRSELRGIKRLLDAIAAEDGIIMLQGHVGQARRHGGKAIASIGGEEMPFDHFLVCVGREPALPEIEGIDLDYPPPGFKIAGDARHGGLGQTAMAVGDGVRMAMEAGREVGE